MIGSDWFRALGQNTNAIGDWLIAGEQASIA